jgi:hypothetical protein
VEGVILKDTLVAFNHLSKILQGLLLPNYTYILRLFTSFFDDFTKVSLTVLHQEIIGFLSFNSVDEFHDMGIP